MARHTREFWEGLLSEVDGGEELEGVARRHRVKPRTLQWWRWRLAKKRAATSRLLPVVVASPSPSSQVVSDRASIEIAVASVHLRVPVGADVEYVAALVASLRAAC